VKIRALSEDQLFQQLLDDGLSEIAGRFKGNMLLNNTFY